MIHAMENKGEDGVGGNKKARPQGRAPWEMPVVRQGAGAAMGWRVSCSAEPLRM